MSVINPDSAGVIGQASTDPIRPAAPLTRNWVIGMAIAGSGLAIVLWSWISFVQSQNGRAPHGYLAQTDFNLWFAHARLMAAGHGDQIYDFASQHQAQLDLIAPNQQLGGGLINHYWPVLGG